MVFAKVVTGMRKTSRSAAGCVRLPPNPNGEEMAIKHRTPLDTPFSKYVIFNRHFQNTPFSKYAIKKKPFSKYGIFEIPYFQNTPFSKFAIFKIRPAQ